MTDFFKKLGEEILLSTYQHVYLTFFAMLLACALALPLGIFLARCHWRRFSATVMSLIGLIQPIPSLALVALIVAIFKFVHLPSIGVFPGLAALVCYALLPILRNTYTGLRQVDPNILEVARGMGMTSKQMLFNVEFPLALPVVMAGIRIATVWTIGVATLVSLVGAGGLGDLIFKGLRSYHVDYILAGTIPAAALALVFDCALGFIEKLFSHQTTNEQRN